LRARKEIAGEKTDENGRFKFSILPLASITRLSIEVSSRGYLQSRTTVNLNQIKLNYPIYLEIDKKFIFCDNPAYYRIPLIDRDNPGSTTTFSSFQIKEMGR
jgi:hypothetical protein